MRNTAESILDLGRDAQRERQLKFFGAFRPSGRSRWDIVISVPGLTPDQQEIYSFVAHLMRTYAPELGGSGHLGRVVALDEHDTRINEVEQLASGRRRITNFRFGDADIAEAYLLRLNSAGAAA